MPKFKTPLRVRMAKQAAWRERYANDADFRLAWKNGKRRRAGLPPVNTVPTLSEWARSRPRAERGRFV